MRIFPALVVVMLFGGCDKDQPVGPAGPSGGKPRVCTEIGCTQGLAIQLQKAKWDAGNYTFAFDVDGTKVTCKGALPLKACEAGPSLQCDPGGRVTISESGCALPADGSHAFDAITFLGEQPRAVELTIIKEETTVHSGKLTPTYTTTTPNGPDCPPVCTNATEIIQLP